MKKFFGFLLAVVLSVNTALAASMTVENYTAPQLKQALMKFFIKQGAQISDVTDYSMTAKIKNVGFLYGFFYGSRFNSYPELRTTLSFVQDGKNTIVSANSMMVTNPNSSFETATPMGEYSVMQFLEGLNKAINGWYGYSFQYKKKKDHIRITGIDPQSPDARKLFVGNKIYKINDNYVKGMSKADIDYKFSPKAAKVQMKLSVMTDEKDTYKDVVIESKFYKPMVTKESL